MSKHACITEVNTADIKTMSKELCSLAHDLRAAYDILDKVLPADEIDRHAMEQAKIKLINAAEHGRIISDVIPIGAYEA